MAVQEMCITFAGIRINHDFAVDNSVSRYGTPPNMMRYFLDMIDMFTNQNDQFGAMI